MGLLGLLHHHPHHRARQIRWVVPTVGLLLIAALGAIALQYQLSEQAVGTEFFHAHKTISHTGELVARGSLIGGAVLIVVVLAIAVWAFRFTHRIVRPVHTIHRTLDALVVGDLGVRIALHRDDEFRDVGDALNRLVEEFSTTLTTVHRLVDRLAVLIPADASSTTGTPATMGDLRRIVAELDQAMEFFRLEPRRTIEER